MAVLVLHSCAHVSRLVGAPAAAAGVENRLPVCTHNPNATASGHTGLVHDRHTQRLVCSCSARHRDS